VVVVFDREVSIGIRDWKFGTKKGPARIAGPSPRTNPESRCSITD
jgi:hypothetical protein